MHIIVGIDPGKTSGLVCLDLDGRVIFSKHKTFAGVGWLVDEIRRIGVPSIIACDREPNDIVRKVGAAFNAHVFSPDKVVSSLEKSEISRPLGIKNVHERDACAAAIKAYNAHANKLKQAERLAKQRNVGDVDRIKAKIIDKYSIDEAILDKDANRR